jgi:hypothetical protein
VVDGIVGGVTAGLTFELLVKGEEGSLRDAVDVSCSSSAAGDLVAAGWETLLKARGWAGCDAASGGFWSFEGVACSSTAGVGVFGDGWVWLGDEGLVGRHCG